EKKAGSRTSAPLGELPIGSPWDSVAIDIVKVAPSSRGNKYLLVAQDQFSKYLTAVFTGRDPSLPVISQQSRRFYDVRTYADKLEGDLLRIREFVEEHLVQAAGEQKSGYDRSTGQLRMFSPGDEVLLRIELRGSKLAPYWEPGWQVLSQRDLVVEIQKIENGRTRRVNVNRLRPRILPVPDGERFLQPPFAHAAHGGDEADEEPPPETLPAFRDQTTDGPARSRNLQNGKISVCPATPLAGVQRAAWRRADNAPAVRLPHRAGGRLPVKRLCRPAEGGHRGQIPTRLAAEPWLLEQLRGMLYRAHRPDKLDERLALCFIIKTPDIFDQSRPRQDPVCMHLANGGFRMETDILLAQKTLCRRGPESPGVHFLCSRPVADTTISTTSAFCELRAGAGATPQCFANDKTSLMEENGRCAGVDGGGRSPGGGGGDSPGPIRHSECVL
uniref:DUF5641 domain-containing protein n=1 Tax=Macrostomum lignano TaxID=282301 RepID=A0A1I8F7G0_9PLAT